MAYHFFLIKPPMTGPRLCACWLALTVLGPPSTSQADGLPELGAWAGRGDLEQTAPGGKQRGPGELRGLAAVPIDAEHGCRGLALHAQDRGIVAIVRCAGDRWYLCLGGAQHCPDGKARPARRVERVVEFTTAELDYRYRAEFHAKQLIYRIQRRPCLVSYPHGCLVPGPGWQDSHTYRFSKDSVK